MPNIDATSVSTFAADPMAFFEAAIVPSADGPRRFGEIMTPFQRDWLTAIAPSLLALANGERPPIGRFFLEATKGLGKDLLCALCILWLLAFTRWPQLGKVGAAKKDQADELRQSAEDLLHLNVWLADRIEVQSSRLLCDATNSECEIISADDEGGAHGSRPTITILNELSHIAKEDFAETMLDNAVKMPGGLTVVCTNAGFLDSYAWRLRELARESDRWAFHRYAEPAPWIDPADIEDARRRSSASRFNRLWYGVWASGTGDALDPDDVAAAVKENLQPMFRPEPGLGYIGGIDLGVNHDHSAICILAGGGQRIRLAYIESWQPVVPEGGGKAQVNLIEVMRTAIEVAQVFGCGYMYDPAQCELMAQQMREAGIPMEPVSFQGKSGDRMANELLQAFRNRVVDLYPDDGLVRDLGRLSIVERPWGYKLEAPRDRKGAGHCDKAMAFAIALPHAFDSVACYTPLPEWALAEEWVRV